MGYPLPRRIREETVKRQNGRKLTRREVLKLSNGLAAGSLLGATLASPEAVAAEQKQQQGEPTFKVVSPIGESPVKMINMAPRLDNLDGKTICLATNRLFKYEVTFPVIEKLLKEKYPNSKIIPFNEFRVIGNQDLAGDARVKALQDLGAQFVKRGCQAVIAGNGG